MVRTGLNLTPPVRYFFIPFQLGLNKSHLSHFMMQGNDLHDHGMARMA